MKILFVNPSEITMPGGVHEVIRKLGEGLTSRGHEVMVFQFNPHRKPKMEIVSGFKVFRVDTRDFYGFSIRGLKRLSQLIQDWNPDIIHVHGYHTLFSPIAIMKIKRINPSLPLVFSPHYMPSGHNTTLGKLGWPVYNMFNNVIVFPRIDHIIVASQFEKDSLINDIPSSRSIKITVIPHGVDKILKVPYIKLYSNRTIKLLFAGYLHERKGIQFILMALHELVYNMGIRNVFLKIIGEGDYKRKLIDLALRLKLKNFIVWEPFVPTKKELLEEIKRADILLLLSKNENYGIIVAEALSLGTPVIVTDNSALHEFTFEKGCFGVKYPPDPKEVALTILKIIEKPIKVGPFTKKIRPWSEVVGDYEEIYKELVSGDGKD